MQLDLGDFSGTSVAARVLARAAHTWRECTPGSGLSRAGRIRWQKRTVDLLRWIDPNNGKSRAKAAKRRTRKARLTSGRARKLVKQGEKGGWQVTGASRSSKVTAPPKRAPIQKK